MGKNGDMELILAEVKLRTELSQADLEIVTSRKEVINRALFLKCAKLLLEDQRYLTNKLDSKKSCVEFC